MIIGPEPHPPAKHFLSTCETKHLSVTQRVSNRSLCFEVNAL
jgi:hypothetical protein